ncbi:MAG: hypothetical protein WC775_02715 [Patescibacteria group bacterium]|jgi:methionyl-tRNA synthetase
MITIDDFSKLDIRIGTIVAVEKVENADKLLKFEINFGDEQRQVMSGIAEFIPDPSTLIGKQVPVLLNLPYRKFRGFESQGMILMGDDGVEPVLLHPAKSITAGSSVR